MKILFVGNGLLDTDNYPIPNQGGSVQTWGLARELAQRGHNVFIIKRSISQENYVFENVHLVSVKFRGIENVFRASNMSFAFHVQRTLSSFYFSIKCVKLVTSINPDLIFLIDRVSGYFPSNLKKTKIFILHVPEAMDFFKSYAVQANKLNSVMFYVKRALEQSIMKKSERIIVLNSYIENYLRIAEFSNSEKISNGINTSDLINKGYENFIMYAGRFDWNKNVYGLVEAFAEIAKDFPDYNLCLVGQGPEEEKIRKFIAENNLNARVVIYPWLPRSDLIAHLMSKCSVFVLPAYFEVNPVIVLEAMALAKPVIAKINMGTVEIIHHNKNGYLYGNRDELKKYLRLLLSDRNLVKKIGSNARETIDNEYTFSRITDMYEELFERL
jgi:glycosyltransferase involved in cell wall biosynthesis